MDLRPYLRTPRQVELACQVLSYQPYIITDNIQTGVAYSWLYDREGGRRTYAQSEFVFDKATCLEDVWERASDANQRLRNMYKSWLDTLVSLVPGGSVAEVGCNNGYFLVGAQRRGMGPCSGVDAANYGPTVGFLNEILKTDVRFNQVGYDLWSHTVPGLEPHDLVIASAVLQHISDPLYFLSYLGRIARKALFLFTGMGETDQYLVYYSAPNKFDRDKPFPVCFDNDVGLSRGLLMKSLDMLGFRRVIEIPWQPDWLPLHWKSTQKALVCLRD